MVYQFGDMELDLGRRQLSRGTHPIKLPKLSFQLLQALVEAAPNLLSHDELINKVWGQDRVITPENLSQRVKMLRESLGDSAESPTYIEGIRGQGYRLIPEVTQTQAASAGHTSEVPPAVDSATPKRSWLSALIVVALCAGLALIIFNFTDDGYKRKPGAREDSRSLNSVAVLPFSNLSPDPTYSYYALGIHEELLNQLAKLASLRVISRTSMLRYANTTESIPEIAKELNVDSLVEGSVRYFDNRIRVTVQLVDGKSDEHLWSNTYDREMKDFFEIESDIARDVAVAMRLLTADEAKKANTAPDTTSLEAYALYVQAQKAVVHRAPKQLRQALQQFREATRLDPDYLLAWVGVANTLDWLGTYSSLKMEDTLEERQQAIDRALELNSLSGEAWLAQATLSKNQNKPEDAEKYYLRSIELSPGHARAYHWYGLFLNNHGRPEEAVTQIRKALSLDPLSPTINGVLSQVLWSLGRAEEALVSQRKLIALAPEQALSYPTMRFFLTQLGHLDEAAFISQQAVKVDPEAYIARFEECEALLQLGDDKGAEASHQQLVADFPDNPKVANFPNLMLYRGQNREFLTLMEQQFAAIDQPWTRTHLALAHLYNGNLKQARKMIADLAPKYFDSQPDNLTPGDLFWGITSGILLYHTGDQSKANALFDQLLTVMESMHRTRGGGYQSADIVIHAARGDHDAAVAALRTAIDGNWRYNWWKFRGPEFEALRANPEWQAQMSRLETDIARQRERFYAHKDDPEYWQ